MNARSIRPPSTGRPVAGRPAIVFRVDASGCSVKSDVREYKAAIRTVADQDVYVQRAVGQMAALARAAREKMADDPQRRRIRRLPA